MRDLLFYGLLEKPLKKDTIEEERVVTAEWKE